MVSGEVLTNCIEGEDLAHLQFRYWRADRSTPSSTVVLCIHGIESHAGWFDGFAKGIAAAGVDCLSYDRLGNGLNLKVAVASMEQMLADLKSLTTKLQRQYEQVLVLGMSWGGLLAAYALTLDIISPRYTILLAPGIYSHKSLPCTHLLRTLSSLIFPSTSQIPIPIATADFSLQDSVRNLIEKDPLRRVDAPAHIFVATQKMRVGVRAAHLPSKKVEAWLAAQDEIIDNAPLQKYLKKQQVPIHLFEGHGHALIFECPEKLSKMLLERVHSLGLQ